MKGMGIIMPKVIGVRFKPVGKIYYFSPVNFDIKEGDSVIVETSRGVEFGTVVSGVREVSDNEIIKPLKEVMRLATDEDIKRQNDNKKKEKDALIQCEKKIKEHGLEMNLIEAEYTFDGSKLLFYFTADGRIDFRDLVKDLAVIFRTRIELRQIGVRDESKMVGSVGVCGRDICCSKFLGEFVPVSIKMAKEQGLSLNPTKISGICGRLMCCLKYEQDTYEELLKYTPREGSLVKTPKGEGIVQFVSILKGLVKVKLEAAGEQVVEEFNVSDIKILKNSKAKEEETIDAKALKELED